LTSSIITYKKKREEEYDALYFCVYFYHLERKRRERKVIDQKTDSLLSLAVS